MNPQEDSHRSSKDPIWPIASHNDLTPEQRFCCDDIISALRLATTPCVAKITSPAQAHLEREREPREFYGETFEETRDHLWESVFGPDGGDKTWNTSKSVGLSPQFQSQTPSPRIVAGEFTQDLPLSKNTLRLAPKKGVRAERRKGAQALMYPRMTRGKEDTIEWFCCDVNGKGASEKYIKFNALGTPAERADALVLVDANNWSAVNAYNKAYAKYLMKKRLLRVAIAQQPPKLMVQRWPDPTAGDFVNFKTHRSMPLVVLRQPSTGERALLQAQILERRKQIPYSIDFSPPRETI